MVQKKAVLIGCNYPDKPQVTLHGCVNDVKAVKQMLLDQFGFQEQVLAVSRCLS